MLLVSLPASLFALAPVFFDTAGRLQRVPAPANPGTTRFYTLVHNGQSLVKADGCGWKPALLSASEVSEVGGGGALQVFLGSVEDAASPLQRGDYWLLETSALDEQPPASIGGDGAAWEPLRARAGPSVCDALEVDEAALLATARGLAHWHNSVRFCSKCGSAEVVPYRNGKGRRCNVCSERFRPRLDASVIVLVLDATRSRCLLGRKAAWPTGRYSTLAGFVEFGETLEECVVREVCEESGCSVDRSTLDFVASQPWLFPRSLMVGFTVCAAPSEGADAALAVDEDELEDARWFSKEYVREQLGLEREAGRDGPAVEGGFHVPSRVSLARTLIESWLAE